MSRATRSMLLLGWTLAALTMTVTSANAYVDAGSTSVIFQAVIAFIAAAGTGFAMFRQKISAMFRKNKNVDVEVAGEGTDAPDSEHV